MFAKSFEILGRIEFFLGQNTISNVKAARICYSGNLSVPIHWIGLIKCISAAFSLHNTEDPILWRQLPCMTTGWTVPFQGTFQDKKQLLIHFCTQFFGQHPRKLCKGLPTVLEVRRSHVALSSQLSGCQSCPLAMVRASSALPRRLTHNITRWHHTQIKEINP